jgi:hypothetical protein
MFKSFNPSKNLNIELQGLQIGNSLLIITIVKKLFGLQTGVLNRPENGRKIFTLKMSGCEKLLNF